MPEWLVAGNELRRLPEQAMSFAAPAPQYWVKGRNI
jgi:hypothetical protein